MIYKVIDNWTLSISYFKTNLTTSVNSLHQCSRISSSPLPILTLAPLPTFHHLDWHSTKFDGCILDFMFLVLLSLCFGYFTIVLSYFTSITVYFTRITTLPPLPPFLICSFSHWFRSNSGFLPKIWVIIDLDSPLYYIIFANPVILYSIN